jgi:hypothetical protein
MGQKFKTIFAFNVLPRVNDISTVATATDLIVVNRPRGPSASDRAQLNDTQSVVTLKQLADLLGPLATPASNHNDLDELQGGHAGLRQFYHLTLDQHTRLPFTAYTDIDNMFSAGQTINNFITTNGVVTALGGTSTEWNTAFGWGDWSTGVNKAFVDALGIDADTLDGQDGAYYLDYNNFTNTPVIPGTPNLQAVTDVGSITTNAITTGAITTNGDLTVNADDIKMSFAGGHSFSMINTSGVTWGFNNGVTAGQWDLRRNGSIKLSYTDAGLFSVADSLDVTGTSQFDSNITLGNSGSPRTMFIWGGVAGEDWSIAGGTNTLNFKDWDGWNLLQLNGLTNTVHVPNGDIDVAGEGIFGNALTVNSTLSHFNATGSGNALKIGDSTNSQHYISFRDSGSSGGFVGYNGADTVLQSGSAKTLKLLVNSGTFSTGSTVAVDIDTSANVSIPNGDLDVTGTIQSTSSNGFMIGSLGGVHRIERSVDIFSVRKADNTFTEFRGADATDPNSFVTKQQVESSTLANVAYTNVTNTFTEGQNITKSVVAGDLALRISNTAVGGNLTETVSIYFDHVVEGRSWAAIVSGKDDVGVSWFNDYQGNLQFHVIKGQSSPSEVMRINSEANLLIGTQTDNGSRLNVVGKGFFDTSNASALIDVASQAIGSMVIGNNSGSIDIPSIVGKSDDGNGLYFIGATNDSNAVGDIVFNVRENDNSDFATLTSKAFVWSRWITELMSLTRDGDLGILGAVTANTFLGDGSSLTGVIAQGVEVQNVNDNNYYTVPFLANGTNEFYRDTAGGLLEYNPSLGNLRLNSVECATGISTGIPTAGTGTGSWKFGINVATAVTLKTTNYLEVSIDGIGYRLALAN